MKAVVCVALGKTLEEGLANLKAESNFPIPQPKAGEVQIKVKAAALNFFDGLILQNKYQMKYKPPFVVGSEFSGVISKVGKGVKSFKVGDRVCGMPHRANNVGTFAEYTIAVPSSIWKIPDNMDYINGAGFTVTYGTAYMAMVQRGKVSNKDNVLITAASGGLGSACVQISKAKHAKCIIGLVGSKHKEDIAKKFGCHVTLNYRKNPKWSLELKKILKNKNITDHSGLDLVGDIVGGESFNQSLKLMNWYGRVLILGWTGGIIQKIKSNRILLKSIDVLGVAWGATAFHNYNNFRNSVTLPLEMYSNNLLNPLIYKVYNFNLESVSQSYLDMFNRITVGKLIINIDCKLSKL